MFHVASFFPCLVHTDAPPDPDAKTVQYGELHFFVAKIAKTLK